MLFRSASVPELPPVKPFASALEVEPEFLLVSNVIYDSLDSHKPFSFLKQGVSLIRSALKYEGIILSDDLIQPALLDNYPLKEIATAPLKAGVNMLILSLFFKQKTAYDILLEEAQQDPLIKQRVEDSAARIVTLKESMSVPFQSSQFSQNN